MRKTVAVLGIVGAALVLGFVVWSFTLHGTIGLYRVNGTYQRYFNGAIGWGVLLLVLALLLLWLRQRLRTPIRGLLSVVVAVLAVPSLLAPVAFVYVGWIPIGGIGDTPPRLLLADGTGKYGIPNLAVTFNATSAEKVAVYWGTDSEPGAIAIDPPPAVRQHVYMLRDLKPATDYWYQIGKVRYPFRTPSLDSLHFAVGSDAHFGVDSGDVTSRMLRIIGDPSNKYDYLFLLGDTVHHGFSASEWREAFQTLSPTTSIVPTRFAIGNHDTLFTGLGRYERYCYPPGMEVQTGSRMWYRIDVGKVHFLVIDLEWSAESYTRRQAEWLEAQLKSIPADEWKIVMGHGFYYGSGSIDDGWQWYDNMETIQALTPLFEKYRVDIVFSGHAHQLELLQHWGVSYVIAGGFGGVPDVSRSYVSPASRWYASGEHGFVEVSVRGDSATLVFRTPDNAALKTAVISKTGDWLQVK